MRTTLPDLTGRTALVTGGGTGIGKGCAAALAAAGAAVTICGPDASVLDEAQAELRSQSPAGTISSTVCDVTHEEQVAAAVERGRG